MTGMGLRSALRLQAAIRTMAPVSYEQPAGAMWGNGIGSPWADRDHLLRLTWADVFGDIDSDLLPISRSEAMSVPSVAAARHRIVSTLSRLPIRAYVADTDTRWTAGATDLLDQPDTAEPHLRTMTKTFDDQLFDGSSFWGATAVNSSDGRPTDVVHVPRGMVQVDQDGRVTIDTAFSDWLERVQGRRIIGNSGPTPMPMVIYFEGPHPGLLSFGSRAIRASVRLDRAAARAADNPVPSIELHQTNDADMDDDDVKDLLRQWMNARRGENGGVGYTSAGIEAKAMGQQPEQLLIDARNQQSVEIARLAGIPADAIDAAVPGTALTYANRVDRVTDLINYGLQPYAEAVSQRLSMSDCLPRGVTARWDYGALTVTNQAAPDSTSTNHAPARPATSPIGAL